MLNSVGKSYAKEQIWATSWQNQQNGCASNEHSDQPGHLPSLISLRCLHEESLGSSNPLSAQGRLWSDWADAQADPSFRWAHTHFVGFVMLWLFFLSALNNSSIFLQTLPSTVTVSSLLFVRTLFSLIFVNLITRKFKIPTKYLCK